MLRLRTFGSVDLQGPDDRDLHSVLAQPKRLALLIYLAVARPAGVHRRDELLALFWPDLDDTRARDALNQALRFLRQALGPDVFVRRGGEDVGVDPAMLWCDATAYHASLEVGRPSEALELYRGDFLQGFFIEGTGGFEEWMERERAAFRESAARGARQLAEEHASGGALTLAIDWGRRALELAPDDERALRRLLKLFDKAGDRAGAFRVYEAFVRRFEEEFGGEPSPETKALADRLKAGLPLMEERDSPARPAVVESPRPFAKDSALDMGDRYRIIRKLGAGGMATVYLAQDVKHDREVALKVLRPEIAEGLARERFLREIRIAGQLQHPNIVPLFDSGEADGRLYFVMAHIEGETLRQRLVREKQFEIAEVVHLLREVAGALVYAHERGVIHRDIKPENILLMDRRAVLADFGIARAAHAARTPAGVPDETLTIPGTSLGTPAYMSPEQAAGQPDVDQRADLYAMGVLGYEMLAGRPPFVAATGHQVLAAHLLEPPVPIAQLRADTSAALGALIMRCLEKKPADRPDSASAFLAQLDGGVPVVSPAPWWLRRSARRKTMVAGGVLVAVLSAVAISLLAPGNEESRRLRAPAASGTDSAVQDTSRYAILPFARAATVAANLPIEQFVQDALGRWDGISVVDRFQVNDAMTRRDSARFTSEDAARVAAEVGAGRYIRGEVTPIGDSLRIHAGLFDLTRNNRVVAEGTIRVKASLAAADSAFATLADDLLFPGGSPGNRVEARVGTRSLPARQAYGRGYAAIQEWELARADSDFVQATELDSAYAEAFLWLAQVRSWRGIPASQWSFAAERAASGRDRLSRRDRNLSDALTALAAGEIPKACATLIELTKQEPHDFAAWYGMGTCLSRDSIVVRDGRSPSGWAFRSSYGAALTGYSRAFSLLPSIHKSLRNRGFEHVRALLKTSAQYPRSGATEGRESIRFAAFPSIEHDTLGFIPYTTAQFSRSDTTVVPRTLGEAVQRQRELFHRIAAGWAAKYPASSDAVEALAISVQMLGDPASLDTLKRAQALAHTPEDRLRMAGAEVWLRVKMSLPADPNGLRLARRLADSLLRLPAAEMARQPALFASLAVLTGNANLAARLTRLPQVASLWDMPPGLGRTAAPLLVFASLNGPSDSIAELAEGLREAIERHSDPSSRVELRERLLVRAATLAGPGESSGIISRIRGSADYLLAAQQAFLLGDTVAVRASLAGIKNSRQWSPPEDLAMDALFPEAWLLAALGDVPEAITWLDQALMILPRTSPQVSGDPASVAALVRASALRADLAERAGDRRSAARWADAVMILWSDADLFLRPVVDRMRRLAKRGS